MLAFYHAGLPLGTPLPKTRVSERRVFLRRVLRRRLQGLSVKTRVLKRERFIELV